jgi:hypothetical protein
VNFRKAYLGVLLVVLGLAACSESGPLEPLSSPRVQSDLPAPDPAMATAEQLLAVKQEASEAARAALSAFSQLIGTHGERTSGGAELRGVATGALGGLPDRPLDRESDGRDALAAQNIMDLVSRTFQLVDSASVMYKEWQREFGGVASMCELFEIAEHRVSEDCDASTDKVSELVAMMACDDAENCWATGTLTVATGAGLGIALYYGWKFCVAGYVPTGGWSCSVAKDAAVVLATAWTTLANDHFMNCTLPWVMEGVSIACEVPLEVWDSLNEWAFNGSETVELGINAFAGFCDENGGLLH